MLRRKREQPVNPYIVPAEQGGIAEEMQGNAGQRGQGLRHPEICGIHSDTLSSPSVSLLFLESS
jgi:hypothetical protein